MSTKTRSFEFNITMEYAWDLYLNQNKECALSGLPIKFGFTRNKNDETALLGRINSKLGYVESNVQWVHKHVNMMKNAYSQEYFIKLCKLILFE